MWVLTESGSLVNLNQCFEIRHEAELSGYGYCVCAVGPVVSSDQGFVVEQRTVLSSCKDRIEAEETIRNLMDLLRVNGERVVEVSEVRRCCVTCGKPLLIKSARSVCARCGDHVHFPDCAKLVNGMVVCQVCAAQIEGSEAS